MPATNEYAVECQGLQKSYGTGPNQVLALRGIDLSVSRGELFMLVGPSGCGKTTLISIMTGVLNPTGGVCQVLGRDLGEMSERQRTRYRGKEIGFVFQQFNLLPTLSLRQNAALPLLLGGTPYGDALRQADAALARVGLGDRTQATPRELFGGQQRVAIARAIIHRPQLLVCDEPTSALDHSTGQQIMELLRSLNADGNCTLVVVTHDSRIFQYADRIAEMEDGRVTGIHDGNASPATEGAV